VVRASCLRTSPRLFELPRVVREESASVFVRLAVVLLTFRIVSRSPNSTKSNSNFFCTPADARRDSRQGVLDRIFSGRFISCLLSCCPAEGHPSLGRLDVKNALAFFPSVSRVFAHFRGEHILRSLALDQGECQAATPSLPFRSLGSSLRAPIPLCGRSFLTFLNVSFPTLLFFFLS